MDGIAVAVTSESNPAACTYLLDPDLILRMPDVVVHWCLRAF